MTSSPADDPLDPQVSAAALHEARSRLLGSARAAQQAWLLALGLALVLVLGAATLFAVSLFVSPGYVLMWTILLSAAIYNVTRFWPTPLQPPGVSLAADQVRRLRHALDPHTPGWPARVSLVPDPVALVCDRRLTLGMPLLACLAPDDLKRLIAIGERASSSLEEDNVLRRARSLAEGDIGRSLHLWRRQSRAPRGLTRQIHVALAEYAEEYERWLVAFRRNAEASSTRDSVALHHQDLVVEGWQLMRKEWLDPAVARGCWHPAPFSSLREFLVGLDAVGALDGALPARPSRGPVVDLVDTHEAPVADVLLGDRLADDLRSITWAEHPTMVTVPLWRAIVVEALDVSRQLTGLATPPTVEGMLGLLESGDLMSVARHVAPDHGLEPDDTDWVSLSRWVGGYPALLLTAIVGMAAIDSGKFRPRWSWPGGSSLVNAEGWVIPLHTIATEVLRPHDRTSDPAIHELGMLLRELGIDVTEPLWLTRTGGNTAAQPERPTGSFVAYQGLGSRQVIVTDRALHVFGRPWSDGLRNHYAERMRGADELRTRMLRVWQGDETDQTALLHGADVARAKFSVLTGGHRWRLVLHSRGEKVTLRGFGDGRAQEEQVAALLHDRLTTAWLHSSRRLLLVRNVIGRVGLAVGALALVAALVLAVVEPVGWAESTAPLVAVGGVLALFVAVLPDIVMEVVWKVRGHAERPEPLVLTRRYARSSAKPAPRPLHDGAPLAGRASALESMTLDLGDLPVVLDWPDDLDIDDLDIDSLDLDEPGPRQPGPRQPGPRRPSGPP